jgi:MFS family permease
MSTLILGRILGGIGGAGSQAMVSLIIIGICSWSLTWNKLIVIDLFPIREVASLRSYVNIVATTGRSLGGPIGGALADTIGWRWYVIILLAQQVLI